MKIVVLDGFTLNPGDLSWDELKTLGDVKIYDRTPFELILKRIGESDAIFTNKTPLIRDILERSKNIKFIGVLATGYNVVDIEAARAKGITVCNVPAYSTNSVAQFTFALLLELCHHVGEHDAEVKKGTWSESQDFCFWKYPLIELAGKTLGIIGFGQIGQAVARIALSFGMKVLAYSRNPDKSLENENLKCVSLENVFADSDVVSLHCPLTESTKGLINEKNISKMKDGVFIINTSRGPVVVEEDLAHALKNGKVAGAALDVMSVEPVKIENILLKTKNCIITPHIAWAPKEARKRLMSISVDNLRRFIAGTPINVVSN